MLTEDKSVKHVLSVDGQETTFEGGYHLRKILESFKAMEVTRHEVCETQYAKYFGPETEVGKLAEEIKTIAAKKPEEQTPDDMEKVSAFIKLRKEASDAYLADPATPKVCSTRAFEGNEQVLFDSDLKSLIESVEKSLMTHKDAAELIGRAIYEAMLKSDLKLAAVEMKFEDSAENKESNHSFLTFGSAFRDILPADVAVLDGTIMEIHDRVIPDIRKKLGIAEEPTIVVPGTDGQ